jgi:glycosyltransferase involved in cell wall biosynthesis
MHLALVVTGGVDRSGVDRIIPTLLALIERLARDHVVVVYVLRYHDRPCRYRLLGASIEDLGSPPGLRRQYSALVDALRRDGPFDVMHAMWAMPAGIVAACAGRRLHIPVVLTADSGEFVAVPEVGYGLQRTMRHRLGVAAAMRLASQVTVCSGYMDRLARRHGVSPVIIPLGVNGEVFRPPAGRDPGAASGGPPWRLLHVASLNPVKDQALLLDAFRRVVEALPPGAVHLDIVGEDTMDGVVQRRAASLGLNGQVRFHGGLPTSAVVPLYQQADLVVISSRHEAACVVALEAAATGVPVVGTDVGYLNDWSPHRAVAVPVGDAPALARSIVDLLGDPGRRRTLARAAREWSLAHDADWTAVRFAALYEDLRATRRRGMPLRARQSGSVR